MANLKKKDKDRINNTLLAAVLAHEDAEIKGLGKDKGGSGDMPCPVCKRGKIRYSVAASNAHIMGACTTKKCVRWIE